MNILIDCSSIQVGGGMQVAQSFFYDLLFHNTRENIYNILLSPQIEESIDKTLFNENFHFHTLEKRFYSNPIRRALKLKSFEVEVKPEIVFCLFGPSFYKSKVPKIVGYAIPHYIYTESPYFSTLTILERIKAHLYRFTRTYLFNKNSDILVFETEDAREKYCTKYNFPCQKTEVVSNTINQVFLSESKWENVSLKGIREHTILCLSANYPHKNLQIIPLVIDHLIQKHELDNFKFVVTSTKEELRFGNKYDDYIEYIGKIKVEMIPSLYQSASLLFLPTLLEVFSTTYLEAMFMKVPIVTTNLSFSQDICQNGAYYFDPLSVEDASEAIINVITDPILRETVISNASINLMRFGSSLERTKRYMQIIKDLRAAD